jgi:hypothetical protein
MDYIPMEYETTKYTNDIHNSCLIRHYYIHTTSYRRDGYILACVLRGIYYSNEWYTDDYMTRACLIFFLKSAVPESQSHKSDGCMHVCQLNLYHYFCKEKKQKKTKKTWSEIRISDLTNLQELRRETTIEASLLEFKLYRMCSEIGQPDGIVSAHGEESLMK